MRDQTNATHLGDRFSAVRAFTKSLCEPLRVEDYVVQTMPDVSPTKWHLAHTTWFFETFVLGRLQPQSAPFNPAFAYLFNSYYNLVGPQFPRPNRGLLSRPTVDEVFAYRAHVDERIGSALDHGRRLDNETLSLVELGMHHEQQHQELMLTDLKHVFGSNPIDPAYLAVPSTTDHGDTGTRALQWLAFDGGLNAVGHDGAGFAFDNEGPRHRRLLQPFELGSRLVTNEEYLAFIDDDGYRRPELWLSEGWSVVQREGWEAPLYWRREDKRWSLFTLGGRRAIRSDEPVCHVSYYEADAFAAWARSRLPDEAEWEVAVGDTLPSGNFVESGALHPRPSNRSAGLEQCFGDVWEWTRSAYSPYPRYWPASGAVGEYNGKFMCGQFVLRGGSCATSVDHIRSTYRNFFPPDARWQFTGIRLARD
jgi:ergothioneine biosynthesis protein EgtB